MHVDTQPDVLPSNIERLKKVRRWGWGEVAAEMEKVNDLKALAWRSGT